METVGPLAEVFRIHSAIKHNVLSFRDEVNKLQPKSGEKAVIELERDLQILKRMVLDHCSSEDRIILPALTTKISQEEEAEEEEEEDKEKEMSPASIHQHNILPAKRKLHHQNQDMQTTFTNNNSIIPASSKIQNIQSNILELNNNNNNNISILSTSPMIQNITQKKSSPQDSPSPSLQDTLRNWHKNHQELYTVFETLSSIFKALRSKQYLAVVHVHDPNSNSDHSTSSSDSPNPPTPNRFQNMSHSDILREVRAKAALFVSTMSQHFHEEETALLPLFRTLFSHTEQGSLFVKVLAESFSAPLLPWAINSLSPPERIAFLSQIQKHADKDQFSAIASHIAHGINQEDWLLLCQEIPSLQMAAQAKFNPLIEITHIHKAFRRDLIDIADYCKNMDPTDDLQLNALLNRLSFLRKIHACHADGEEKILMSELQKRIKDKHITDCFYDDHDDEVMAFDNIIAKINHLLLIPKQHAQSRIAAKDHLLALYTKISNHLLSHMDDEENKLLPLVQKYFSVQDQDILVRNVMRKVPTEMFAEMLPWMLSALSTDEQEKLIRNLLRASPRKEFRTFVQTLHASVYDGVISAKQWEELTLRVPDLARLGQLESPPESKEIASPVNEVYRIHKAFRIELQAIYGMTKTLLTSDLPDPKLLCTIANRVTFLESMVLEHSKCEDNVILPTLKERVPGISKKYEDDHCDERLLFRSLSQKLETLQCVSDVETAAPLIKSVQVLAKALRDDMMHHLKLEETNLWPLLTTHFNYEEQSNIVALIFGQMPAEHLREMLPWMLRVLSVEDKNEMMNHILALTKSTMFEKWLRTWFSITDDDDKKASAPSSSTNCIPSADIDTPDSESNAVASLLLMKGKDDVQRAVKAVSRDSTLSSETKSRLMQALMLGPWMRSNAGVKSQNTSVTDEEQSPSYKVLEDGTKALGCSHYRCGCKIRAKCCGKLYPCRLCHDAANNHAIDRYAVKEMMCMHCKTLQPIAKVCCNPECKQVMARYFCEFCNLFDDDSSRDIYHCHSCNVCRVGKGLGIDFFHCMKCNACMSVRFANNHTCIEKSMESDCPVCNHNLFTSTHPVKYLHCGHLMHLECYKEYAKDKYTCPICQKSLADMSSYFERLDQLIAGERMPHEYQTARCDLKCNDCSRTNNVAFHFLYNKCPSCGSYNTKVTALDANAGDKKYQALKSNGFHNQH